MLPLALKPRMEVWHRNCYFLIHWDLVCIFLENIYQTTLRVCTVWRVNGYHGHDDIGILVCPGSEVSEKNYNMSLRYLYILLTRHTLCDVLRGQTERRESMSWTWGMKKHNKTTWLQMTWEDVKCPLQSGKGVSFTTLCPSEVKESPAQTLTLGTLLEQTAINPGSSPHTSTQASTQTSVSGYAIDHGGKKMTKTSNSCHSLRNIWNWNGALKYFHL